MNKLLAGGCKSIKKRGLVSMKPGHDSLVRDHDAALVEMADQHAASRQCLADQFGPMTALGRELSAHDGDPMSFTPAGLESRQPLSEPIALAHLAVVDFPVGV